MRDAAHGPVFQISRMSIEDALRAQSSLAGLGMLIGMCPSTGSQNRRTVLGYFQTSLRDSRESDLKVRPTGPFGLCRATLATRAMESCASSEVLIAVRRSVPIVVR